MKIRILTLIMLTVAVVARGQDYDTLRLTLAQAIRLAQEQSTDALSARHQLEASTWAYQGHKANYLPSLSLSASPNLNRQLNSIVQPDGTSSFVRQNQLSTNLNLSLSQNIWFTGGNLFVSSSLYRQDEFERHTHSYSSVPISIGYSQSLFGHNSLRWDRRTEPLRYRRAQKAYRETMELIASRTCSYFFSLAGAQTSLSIARQNYAVSDTLYRYASRRYDIGTITENEMLQLEVNRLSEETNCMNAAIEVDEAMQSLRSYLAIDNATDIVVVPDSSVPNLQIDPMQALAQALDNSPDPDYYRLSRLESEDDLARARASRGLKAELYMQFGLSQTGATVHDAYQRPSNQQYISLSLSLPLLDWGRGKGQVRVARSRLQLTQLAGEQGMHDFRQNVLKVVNQFNLQSRRVDVARRTRQTALRRYEVARWMYIQGRTTLLEFMNSINEKDAAQRNFIASMRTYWELYYTIRSMTGTSFERIDN
ncbi:MAG: TolC family protein [Bacteroidaceae bacterium]|nr:TolC family protein [Bacteroidaceae bacterium]